MQMRSPCLIRVSFIVGLRSVLEGEGDLVGDVEASQADRLGEGEPGLWGSDSVLVGDPGGLATVEGGRDLCGQEFAEDFAGGLGVHDRHSSRPVSAWERCPG
jgi:hypothetical protein